MIIKKIKISKFNLSITKIVEGLKIKTKHKSNSLKFFKLKHKQKTINLILYNLINTKIVFYLF